MKRLFLILILFCVFPVPAQKRFAVSVTTASADASDKKAFGEYLKTGFASLKDAEIKSGASWTIGVIVRRTYVSGNVFTGYVVSANVFKLVPCDGKSYRDLFGTRLYVTSQNGLEKTALKIVSSFDDDILKPLRWDKLPIPYEDAE
jgi:hypothetical protein